MKLHFAIIFILLSAFTIFGQAPSESPLPVKENDDQPIKVSTLFLNIPVIAGDRDGRNVAGLKKENFTILQDGQKQTIEYFADENAPMNVIILIDTSGSTRYVLNSIKSAAHNFLKTFRPADRGMIASFDYQTLALSDLTSDVKKLNKAIDNAAIARALGSNMQDAIYSLVTGKFAQIRGRKALIVLTDGGVVGRLVSNQKLLYMLSESDVLVYPIIFNADALLTSRVVFPKTATLANGKTYTAEELRRFDREGRLQQWQFLNALGTATGGNLYRNDSPDFKGSFQKIADELKKQYLIGFYPQNIDDGKEHHVVVEVNPKDIVIRTRHRIQL